jgi:protein-S-isoprenylcysteine O-methyltransferase Ste14
LHLVFDIFQGMGVAAAVGIRPFLPALATGALAAGDVQINFDGTDYSFLESTAFLLALAVAAIVLAMVERRFGSAKLERRGAVWMMAAVGAALGALFFAGSLARGHYAAWPGWIGGVICAAIAVAATVPLLARVRGRLEESVATALPAYAEGVALLLAVLSVVAPPVGVIAVVALIWLLLAGRRRGQQKYAGLRILR